MLSRKFADLPQENFAQVFGRSIINGEFPRKGSGCSIIVSLPTLIVASRIWEKEISFQAAPADRWFFIAAAGCLCLQILLWLLFEVTTISRKAPAVGVFIRRLAAGCARLVVFFLADVVSLSVAADRTGLVSVLYAAAFLLLEIICGVIMRTRISGRIINGKYRPDGTAFWDNQRQMDIFYAVMASPVCLLLSLLLVVGASLLKTRGVADIDIHMPAVMLALGAIWVPLVLMVLVGAYKNVRDSVLLYCFRRFGEDKAGYGFDYDVTDADDARNSLPPCAVNAPFTVTVVEEITLDEDTDQTSGETSEETVEADSDEITEEIVDEPASDVSSDETAADNA